LNTQVLGISVDHVPCLTAWAESFGGISYPLLSDFWPHGAVCQRYGVLRSEGYSERALYVLDRNGIIRYVDIHDIDLQPDNDLLRDVIRRMDPEAAAQEPRHAQQEPVPLPHGGIVMYCTSWCPDCKRARAWLAAHNLPYTEVDITTTPGASAQVRAWANGNQTTPTFDIDGTIIVDFDEARLTELLLK
jgi:glutaredoxin